MTKSSGDNPQAKRSYKAMWIVLTDAHSMEAQLARAELNLKEVGP